MLNITGIPDRVRGICPKDLSRFGHLFHGRVPGGQCQYLTVCTMPFRIAGPRGRFAARGALVLCS